MREERERGKEKERVTKNLSPIHPIINSQLVFSLFISWRQRCIANTSLPLDNERRNQTITSFIDSMGLLMSSEINIFRLLSQKWVHCATHPLPLALSWVNESIILSRHIRLMSIIRWESSNMQVDSALASTNNNKRMHFTRPSVQISLCCAPKNEHRPHEMYIPFAWRLS